MFQRVSRGRAAAAVLTGFAFAALLAVVSFDGEGLANDAAQYLSVADNLRAGRGLATSILFYDEHYASGKLPASQTVFPPGYPVAIALVAAAGVSPVTAGFLVGLISLGVCIWLLFSIALARDHHPAVALGCAVAFACLALPWFYVQALLTEPLFLALTLASARWLVSSQHGPLGRPVLAGAAAAGAIAVRYAGLFFAAAVGVVFAIELLRFRRRRTLAHGVAFATPVVAMTAALFWRNIQVVGDLRGGNIYEILRPVGEVLHTFLWSVASLVGVRLRLGSVELVALVALALVAVLALRARGHLSLARDVLAAATRDRAALLTVVYPVVAIAAILYLQGSSPIGLTRRLLVPLVPFAFLFVLEAVRVVRFDARAPRRLAGTALAAVALVYLMGQASVALAELERPSRMSLIVTALAEPLGESTVGDWLRDRARLDHPVIGNEPQLMGAVLHRPVLGLTPPRYSPHTWSADAMLQLARAYGVEYVVLLPEQVSLDHPKDRVPVLLELAAGGVPPWLSPVHVSDAVRVYRVRTSVASEGDGTP